MLYTTVDINNAKRLVLFMYYADRREEASGHSNIMWVRCFIPWVDNCSENEICHSVRWSHFGQILNLFCCFKQLFLSSVDIKSLCLEIYVISLNENPSYRRRMKDFCLKYLVDDNDILMLHIMMHNDFIRIVLSKLKMILHARCKRINSDWRMKMGKPRILKD